MKTNKIKPRSNTVVTLQKECDINLKSFSDMKKKADDMLRERDLERKKSQKQEGKNERIFGCYNYSVDNYFLKV